MAERPLRQAIRAADRGRRKLKGPLSKTLFIKTYGCQMNVYDSARMADVLAPAGYETVDQAEGADLVVLNTCHIREKAAEKVYSELGRVRALKQRAAARGMAPVRVAVAGCVAQAEGAEMLRRAPVVDLVVGPQGYHRLPEMLAALDAGSGPLLETEFAGETKFDHLPNEARPGATSAFLTVQEGCDKFCAFCVVPYTRGAEFSRPVDQIVAEAKRLVAGGTRELTLLGQNVNAYHGVGPDGAVWSLGRLIRHLAEIPRLTRLRYTTSHPRDMDDDLIEAHRDVPSLMPYLHLPVQAGSDPVLQAMNRRHTAAFYRKLVDRVRDARPDIALSSDFIVGFPGETDADFAATLGLVRDIGYAQAFSFKYSPRPGTPGAERADQVPESVKEARLKALQTLLNEQQRRFNAAQIGRTLPVLLDRPGRRPGQLAGRSPYLQAIHVDAAADHLGAIADVLIEGASANALTGTLRPSVTAPAEPARRSEAVPS